MTILNVFLLQHYMGLFLRDIVLSIPEASVQDNMMRRTLILVTVALLAAASKSTAPNFSKKNPSQSFDLGHQCEQCDRLRIGLQSNKTYA